MFLIYYKVLGSGADVPRLSLLSVTAFTSGSFASTQNCYCHLSII